MADPHREQWRRTERALKRRIQTLESALGDLLRVIEVDELIPESVSYMKRARETMRLAMKTTGEPA